MLKKLFIKPKIFQRREYYWFVLVYCLFLLYNFFIRMTKLYYIIPSNYTSYNSIKSRMSTGDILLFQGDCYDSLWVRFFTNNYFSHCGTVVKDPNTDELFIWACHVDNSKINVINKNKRNGNQLNCLDEYINTYQGRVLIRFLSPKLDLNDNYKLKKYIEKNSHIKFTDNPWKSYIKKKFDFIMPQFDKQWCSYMTADTLQYLGIINKNIPSYKYDTDDFISDKKMNLNKNYYYSKPVWIS